MENKSFLKANPAKAVAVGRSKARLFECRPLTEDDLPQVLKFVEEHYTMRNPIRKIFKLTMEDIGCYDKERVTMAIKEGASFGLFHKTTHQLASIVINTVLDKSTPNRIANACEVSAGTRKFEPLQRFMQCVEGDLFTDLDADKILFDFLGAVDPQYAAMGLWDNFNFLGLQERVAQDFKCQYMAMIAVSNFSMRGFEQDGTFSVLREVKYADYVDPLMGQKPDLDLSPIHTGAKLFYKRIAPAQPLPKL